MRLAVSNIAWPTDADETVANVLREHGVTGVEIAPTKYWPQPTRASADTIATYRRRWQDRGLPIVAMQALLYGRNDLTIFETAQLRTKTQEYLCRIIDLAAQLEARALVFGSPKNRKRGELSLAAAEAIGTEFFRELGRHAASCGVELCLEPNPVDYGCDFVVNSAEAIRFVDHVAQDGFGLHLDVGGMTLAQDPPEPTLLGAGSRWKHFHISEPFLAPIGSTVTDHAAFSRALLGSGYDHWASIEMKQANGDNWLESLVQSIKFVRAVYGSLFDGRSVA